MKNIKTASDPHAAKELIETLRKNDRKQKENTLLSTGKTIERMFNYAFVFLIGVALGYAWCFLAIAK